MAFELEKDGFHLSLAETEEDLHAAQRLRYDVFVTELGAGGAGVDHTAQIEADAFDAHSDHMILRESDSGAPVAVYRLMRAAQARRAGGFYSEAEYDLGPLKRSGRDLLELGRSCVRPDYRGGIALFHMWSGLAQYVDLHGCEILFGVASLKGTDVSTLAEPLSLLHHRHLAPPDLRARSRPYQTMDLIDPTGLDRRAAMVALPPLIKAYLRLGGVVGDGAFVDHAFNCTDVCMIMDTAALNARQARYYSSEAAR